MNTPQRRPYFLPLVSVILLSIIIFFLMIIIYKVTHRNAASDLTIFYESAKAFWSHQDIYGSTPWTLYYFPDYLRRVSFLKSMPMLGTHHSTNLNTPVLTLLLLPLASLSYIQVFWVWNLLSIFIGALGIYLLNRIFFQGQLLPFLIMTILFFVSVPAYSNIIMGEIGIFIFGFVVGGWYTARQGFDGISGLLLGFAFSIKLFLGLFLLLFLLLRRWRLLFCMLMTFTICHLTAWFVFGNKAYIEYYWVLHTINWFANSWNASFLGFFIRLFGGEEHIYLFNLPFLTYPFYWLSSLILLIVILYSFLGLNKTKIHFDYQYSLIIVAIFLISPLSWVYYYSLALLPLLLLFKYCEGSVDIKSSFILACALFLYCLPYHLMVVSKMHEPIHILGSFSLRFYATLVFLSLLLFNQSRLVAIPNYQQPRNFNYLLILIWLATLPSINLLLVEVFQ